MPKDKYKHYGGDWCFNCDEIRPDKKIKGFSLIVCGACKKQLKEQVSIMNKGVYLTSKKGK